MSSTVTKRHKYLPGFQDPGFDKTEVLNSLRISPQVIYNTLGLWASIFTSDGAPYLLLDHRALDGSIVLKCHGIKGGGAEKVHCDDDIRMVVENVQG